MIFDRARGLAEDVGEFWGRNAEGGTSTIVSMYLDEESSTINLGFNGLNIIVPIERLKRLLEG